MSGAVQTFRRACFEGVGGYRPVRKSIDGVAECMARMRGWQVHTYPEITAIHLREMGTRNQSLARARLASGIGYYAVGYHPLYMLVRCVARICERPFLVGSAIELAGFLWQAVWRRPKDLSEGYVRFVRAEQLTRLFETVGLRSMARKLAPAVSATGVLLLPESDWQSPAPQTERCASASRKWLDGECP